MSKRFPWTYATPFNLGEEPRGFLLWTAERCDVCDEECYGANRVKTYENREKLESLGVTVRDYFPSELMLCEALGGKHVCECCYEDEG